uniref:DUF4793 domain-containing protein n=1 Tax=Panagrellus redivivus TaxID=6233 RepID=A0A7E5A1Q3_PANRE
MTHAGGVYGLGSEQHDGNFYGFLIYGVGAMCPRHNVHGRSNFTIRELPHCPVIVAVLEDGETLPKNEETKPETTNNTSTVWIVPVCVGLVLLICYVSEPTKSRNELRQKYFNVGWNCPPKTCTLSIEPEKGVFGLAMERHDGNYYGMFVDDTNSWCPRYVIDSRMNFTVIDMPDCSVIIDGALLPKDDVPESKGDSSMKWVIIGICIGIAVLLLIVVVIALYCCIRLKKKPVSPANSARRNQQSQKMSRLPAASPKKSSFKKPAESNTTVSRSPTSNKGSGKPSVQQIDYSDSVTNNDGI